MRERTCGECRTAWRDDNARWCGHCGAALPDPRRPRSGHGPVGRLTAVAAATLLLAGTVATASSRCCPHTTASTSPRQDLVAIDAPAARRSDGIGWPTAKALGGGLLVTVDGDRLVATEAAGTATVFDLDLGDLGLHTGRDDDAAISIQPFDGGVILAAGSTAIALTRSGTQRWRLTTGFDATRVVVADRERIVLVGSDADEGDVLQVVRTVDAHVRFVRPIAALVGVEEQTALVRDAGRSSGVTAVSLTDGTVRWASMVPGGG